MIPLTRLAEPSILAERKVEWTTAFVAGGKKRPDSSKYAHREIVEKLRSMSHNKCFYCESRDARLTVDHHIEVAERRDLAFEWKNLYLACDDCQRKEPNTSIPIAECLDPCEPGVAPDAHLTFAAERATFRSTCGEQTIRKYRLNHPPRINERRGAILRFMEALDRIRQRQLSDNRTAMTDAELAELQRFAQPDEPFSLMFACLLRSKGLL